MGLFLLCDDGVFLRLKNPIKTLGICGGFGYYERIDNFIYRWNKTMTDLVALQQTILGEVENADSTNAIEDIRVTYLGKKGQLSAMMKDLGKMDPDQRREHGQALNKVKEVVTSAIAQKTEAMADAELNARLEAERVDVTLSPRPSAVGKLHPIQQTMDEIIAIFGEMGFTLAEGPDIENDWHNFQALNIPPEHPARQMQDTFYLPQNEEGENVVLRTHTSPVQVRTMLNEKPPIRIIAPGRTYRCDSDMTHTPMFHQVEGLVIDKKSNFAHAKGVLEAFCASYFEVDSVPLKFRPSFFPFTEPSAEVDIQCDRSGGGLKIGKGDDWLEILGCGMVHPNVLRNCGIDPDEYQGFAFGMGIERIAMLKYGIPDLRTFFDADNRWLNHYGFAPQEVPTLLRGLTS